MRSDWRSKSCSGEIASAKARGRCTASSTKLAQLRAEWRNGRLYGYPLCCILLYCWDCLWGCPPSLTRCVSQGVEPAHSNCDWVPCGVLHHGGSHVSLGERLRRIAGFWRFALRPSSDVWRRNEDDGLTPRPPWLPLACASSRPPSHSYGPLHDAFAEIEAQGDHSELSWT